MSRTAGTLPPRDTTFSGRATSIEWPTVAVGVLIIGLYGAVTLGHRHLPALAVIVALGMISGWWSSFQHEVIHGHPFPSERVNEVVGAFAMSLWIPFRVYKSQHLRHHRDALLTDPFEDPESFYCDAERWRRANVIVRSVMWANRTFFGRMIIGPPIALVRFLGSESARLRRREGTAWKDWTAHLVWVAITCVWAFGIAGVPVWEYVVGSVWFGTSVIQIRSFAEHLWQPESASRTAFVDGFFPFGVLFLFNNMHNTHHARPMVPWYQLPRLADHLGSRAAADVGAGYYKGYLEVIKLYGVKPFCVPVHPATPDGSALLAARYGTAPGTVSPS